MTIHSSHPFAVGEQDRNPLRRFRGRMASPVSIWAAAADGTPAGWTLSSFLVADGDPGEVIGLVDEESPLADVLAHTGTLTVNLPGWRQRTSADAFAGVAPAPGGPFTLATWRETEWGPVLERFARLDRRAAKSSARSRWLGSTAPGRDRASRDPIRSDRRAALLRTRPIPLPAVVASPR